MKPIRLTVAVIVTALMFCLTACGSGTKGSGEKSVTIGVINNFPPFEYVDNGKLTGFDIDVVDAALKAEGMKGDWRVMGFDGLIPALQAGQVSLAVSDISVTDERKKVVDFTDPYYTDGQSLAVKAGSGITSLNDLKGKTIVATQGSAGLQMARDVAKKYGATVQVLTASDAPFLAVTSGQADVLAIDTSSIQYRLKKDGAKPAIAMLAANVVSAPTAMAVPRGHEDLVKKLDEGLQKIKADGTYNSIRDKYFG
jgi:ABC-type amino acid transport substrate-binding protein